MYCVLTCVGITARWVGSTPSALCWSPSGRVHGNSAGLDLYLAKDIILATQMCKPCSPWSTGMRHPVLFVIMPCAWPLIWWVILLVGSVCPDHESCLFFQDQFCPPKRCVLMLFFCQGSITLTILMCTDLCLWHNNHCRTFLANQILFFKCQKLKLMVELCSFTELR